MNRNGGDSLCCYVLNGGYGESIVIQLPTGEFGVVDCYTPDLQKATAHPTSVLLRRLGVEQLEFLCLTHPHDDHYRGMAALLREFRPRQFWQFGGMSVARMRTLIECLLIEAESADLREYRDNANELDRVWEEVVNRSARGDLLLSLLIDRRLLGIYGEGDRAVHVYGVAPTSDQIQQYEDALFRYIERLRRGGTPGNPMSHNQVSAALALSFGDTRIMLGGDVESRGWRSALARMEDADCRGCTVVKVSHHGSRNGYCEELWPRLGKPQESIAIITPSVRHGLPHTDAVIHINRFAKEIVRTWPISQRVEHHTRHGAARDFALCDERDSAVQVCGLCTVRVRNDGTCVSCVLDVL